MLKWKKIYKLQQIEIFRKTKEATARRRGGNFEILEQENTMWWAQQQSGGTQEINMEQIIK